MASTTLNSRSQPRNAQPTVGASARELLAAGKHLTVAVWNAAFATAPAAIAAKTAAQEAEDLRSYASKLQHTDPEFAMDLYAAADRHELAQA